MSGKISKSQVPIARMAKAAVDVRKAVRAFKAALASGESLTPFHNGLTPSGKRIDTHVLPNLSAGHEYREFQVGEAHPGDERQRGKRRLVAEVNIKACKISTMYFSDAHYEKGSFYRLV